MIQSVKTCEKVPNSDLKTVIKKHRFALAPVLMSLHCEEQEYIFDLQPG